MVGTVQKRTKRIALALACVSLALVCSPQSRAHDLQGDAEQTKMMAVSGLSLWLKSRFSATELQALEAGDLNIEVHYCGCYDQPKAHFPYSVLVVNTPKGDLVTRPDSTEGSAKFTPLAVRHGARYCKLESEQDCYGSFSEACDFTDFRYGPYLQQFFPTCKSHDIESAMLPRDTGNDRP